MSDGLTIEGNVDETTIPDLFRSITRSSETAIVTLDAAGTSETVFFLEGRIVSASSTDPDLGLAELLLCRGELDLNQYEEATDRMVASRRSAQVLSELGFLAYDNLTQALEMQTREIVKHAVRRRSGNYTIEFVPELPSDVACLSLSTEQMLLDALRSIETWSIVSRGVGRRSRLLVQAPGAEIRGYDLDLSEDEAHVLSLIAEPQSVEVVCSRSYLSNFATCRTLWALLVTGLAQDERGTEFEQKRAATETEYELEGLVERYNTLFQTIFGIVTQKIGDHVYDFIDRVVLHLSPETMPYLSGMNFVNESRVDFDQLYDNLVASGVEDHTAVVHDVLNELLYGWIFEIKKEFGEGLEREIVSLASSIRR